MTRTAMLLLTVLLLPAVFFPATASEQVEDQLVWDFAEFTQAFNNKDWRTALRFVAADTKASFGGDQGPDGVLNVYSEDDTCHAAMAAALSQGCRKIGTGRAMQCVAPPQSAQSDVVYLGARASFQYDEAQERWMALYLICGGD